MRETFKVTLACTHCGETTTIEQQQIIPAEMERLRREVAALEARVASLQELVDDEIINGEL